MKLATANRKEKLSSDYKFFFILVLGREKNSPFVVKINVKVPFTFTRRKASVVFTSMAIISHCTNQR